MTDRAESRFPECVHEFVGMRPSIETHAECIGLKHAVNLRKGGFQPRITRVIGQAASIPGFVIDEIGRVGKDEAGNSCGKLRQELRAVSMDDGVEMLCHGIAQK